MQERFLKWLLGVDNGTADHLVREEIQRKKLRGRTVERTWNFEKKLAKEESSEIATGC